MAEDRYEGVGTGNPRISELDRRIGALVDGLVADVGAMVPGASHVPFIRDAMERGERARWDQWTSSLSPKRLARFREVVSEPGLWAKGQREHILNTEFRDMPGGADEQMMSMVLGAVGGKGAPRRPRKTSAALRRAKPRRAVEATPAGSIPEYVGELTIQPEGQYPAEVEETRRSLFRQRAMDDMWSAENAARASLPVRPGAGDWTGLSLSKAKAKKISVAAVNRRISKEWKRIDREAKMEAERRAALEAERRAALENELQGLSSLSPEHRRLASILQKTKERNKRLDEKTAAIAKDPLPFRISRYVFHPPSFTGGEYGDAVKVASRLNDVAVAKKSALKAARAAREELAGRYQEGPNGDLTFPNVRAARAYLARDAQLKADIDRASQEYDAAQAAKFKADTYVMRLSKIDPVDPATASAATASATTAVTESLWSKVYSAVKRGFAEHPVKATGAAVATGAGVAIGVSYPVASFRREEQEDTGNAAYRKVQADVDRAWNMVTNNPAVRASASTVDGLRTYVGNVVDAAAYQERALGQPAGYAKGVVSNELAPFMGSDVWEEAVEQNRARFYMDHPDAPDGSFERMYPDSVSQMTLRAQGGQK